jgi:hypothetical protein
MLSCDRCRLLFNSLERVIRLDNDGVVKIDTLLCSTCLYETGLFALFPKMEEPETLEIPDELTQEVEPPSYLGPGL